MVESRDFLSTAAEDSSQSATKLQDYLKILQQEAVQINAGDTDSLISILSRNVDSLILNVIADIAKADANRPFLTKETLLSKIVECISSETPDITLQALRCICNICADNDDARKIFSSNGGVKVLLDKAETVLKSDDSWNQIICPACGCIQNLIIDYDLLQQEFLEQNALSILWKFLEKFHLSDTKIAVAVLSGIAAIADSDIGVQKLEDDKVIENLLNLMKKANDEINTAILHDMLTEYGGKENTRVLLSKVGCVKRLSEIIEGRPNFKDQTCTDKVMKEMADLVVLLTSGEESFTILLQNDQDLLSRFSKWIESPNSHIQVSAGLALGNYARSEATCGAIVASKIHENLINVMKENIDKQSYHDRLQAFASCLRNLTIPVPNKPILIEAGLPQLSVEMVKTTVLPVQFKALAILRLLVQGPDDLAVTLCSDKDLLLKICELSEVSAVSSVPSEAQRLMAALVKYSNSEEPIRNALSCDCLKAIIPLLSSDHMLMQNEGVIALIMILANVTDCIPNFTEAECASKVFTLLKGENAQDQTVFNCLTFIQATSALDGGKDVLNSHSVKDILENLKNHSEDLIRNKVLETIGLLDT